MSDSIDEMAAAARAELCGHCRVALPMNGPHHHTSTGFLYWCSVPSEVLALIDRLRQAARVEAAARLLLSDATNVYGQGDWWVCAGCDAAVSRSDGLSALRHHDGCAVAALVKALEGGAS